MDQNRAGVSRAGDWVEDMDDSGGVLKEEEAATSSHTPRWPNSSDSILDDPMRHEDEEPNKRIRTHEGRAVPPHFKSTEATLRHDLHVCID